MNDLVGLLLKTEIHKNGATWYLTVGNLILAIITLEKYTNFSKYIVAYSKLGVDGKVSPVPSQLKAKDTLEDAIAAIRAHLKIERTINVK